MINDGTVNISIDDIEYYKEYQMSRGVTGYEIHGKDGTIQCITDNNDRHGEINILGGHSVRD